MTTKHGMRYKNFILLCDPKHLADGRFGAQVAVADEEGVRLIEHPFPAQDPFATEDEAVEYAKAWGKTWADEHEATHRPEP